MHELEQQNIRGFENETAVREYGKKYLRYHEKAVIDEYMPAGSRVLDVGCGAGRTTYFIDQKGCEVTGIDISAPLIKKAKELYPHIRFEVADVVNLPFTDNYFDVVFFSFNGLDYLYPLERRRLALQEMRRVLKPGGFLIYSSHNSIYIPRTKMSLKILWDNKWKLRPGRHWRMEHHTFGDFTTYYNSAWSELRASEKIGFLFIKAVPNSSRRARWPFWLASLFEKFPMYVFKKT